MMPPPGSSKGSHSVISGAGRTHEPCGVRITVTVKVHGALGLPQASRAMHVTVVTPSGKAEPGALFGGVYS